MDKNKSNDLASPYLIPHHPLPLKIPENGNNGIYGKQPAGVMQVFPKVKPA
ncbi:hypothetical protein SDC9_77026 [bioreactor metagenome]|uniref:Uncharacterized protein n=1 Tax=bioreactor metagenome TaxID=1076179 RepID=A0A644YPP3_9ZZZZ